MNRKDPRSIGVAGLGRELNESRSKHENALCYGTVLCRSFLVKLKPQKQASTESQIIS